jgi:hypothetical protein
MSDRTFVLIHIVDQNRLLSVLAENLPSCGLPTRDNPQFMYQGVTYEVFGVLDHFGDTHAFSTGARLLAVLTKITGSQERAAALLEAVEPMHGDANAAVMVTRNADGTISAVVPSNDYYGLTLVRAITSTNGLFRKHLTATADALIARQASASVPDPVSSSTDATADSGAVAVDEDPTAVPHCQK